MIQPPSFKIADVGGSGKAWYAVAEFSTPKGPASVRVDVTLPETIDALMAQLTPMALIRAACAYIRRSQQKQAQASGFLGVKLPNPLKIVKRGAAKLTQAARAATKAAVSKLPGPARKLVAPLLMAVANASNPLELASAAKAVTDKLGKIKVPGLGVPVLALHPLGAAALYSSKILGSDAAKAIIDNASDASEAAADNPDVASAAGAAVAKAKVKKVAKNLSTDASFARELGIPTISVAPELRDGARMIVGVLKGVYARNPDAIKALQTLSEKAQKGDYQAKMLWSLAVQISDAARGVRAGESVGDGYGPGYGVTGYKPRHFAPTAVFALVKRV